MDDSKKEPREERSNKVARRDREDRHGDGKNFDKFD